MLMVLQKKSVRCDVALIINRSSLALSTMSVIVFLLSIKQEHRTDKMRITLHNSVGVCLLMQWVTV